MIQRFADLASIERLCGRGLEQRQALGHGGVRQRLHLAHHGAHTAEAGALADLGDVVGDRLLGAAQVPRDFAGDLALHQAEEHLLVALGEGVTARQLPDGPVDGVSGAG